MSSLIVRTLHAEDAEGFQRLRLQGLKNHPDAFGSSYEDEVNIPLTDIAARLSNAPDSGRTYFGAFLGGEMVGITVTARELRQKTRHRASIVSMYVAPEARGHGAGKGLIKAALEYLRNETDVEDVTLAVTVGNEAARGLYISLGFDTYGIEPRLFKVGDTYYDVEQMIRSIRG